jgi:hypothetical protein
VAALMAWGDRWAAPLGKPIDLVHSCGHVATPTVVCDHCGDALELRSVKALGGPGWTQAGGDPPAT